MNKIRSVLGGLIPGKLRRETKEQLRRSLFAALSKLCGGNYEATLWSFRYFDLTSENILLRGLCQGVIPLPNMSNHAITEWHDPIYRGIVPIEDFKIRDDLYRIIKKNTGLPENEKFVIKINTDFIKTLESCAAPRKRTSRTWISKQYIQEATKLHRMGIAHSIEVYQNNVLVGGIVGYSVNGCFFTATLFHSVTNAAKIAFYYLFIKLRNSGFKLHDVGWPTPWFGQFGLISMPREDFKKELAQAMTRYPIFDNLVPELEPRIKPAAKHATVPLN